MMTQRFINKIMFLFFSLLLLNSSSHAQVTAEQLVTQVKDRLNKVNDYEAQGKMKTNVVFIKAPIATVKVYFKKPNKLRINNESGISFIPKGSVNINLNQIFVDPTGYDMIDLGSEKGTSFRIIKLLPRDENSEVVLSTLYIDEAKSIIRKAKTTTRESGTYELELTYGKYEEYGLADKIVFSFNTRDYKLPKGITFDYDDGSKKEETPEELKNKKGRVEIVYSSYKINKGVPDSVFQ